MLSAPDAREDGWVRVTTSAEVRRQRVRQKFWRIAGHVCLAAAMAIVGAVIAAAFLIGMAGDL